MRNINNLVKRYENMTETNNTVTDEYCGVSSFYLLPTGQYLNCEASYGMRSEDHRIIFGATKISDPCKDNKAWEKLQCNYQIVRIVPEYPCIMIHEKQVITREQETQISFLRDSLGFTVEYYL